MAAKTCSAYDCISDLGVSRYLRDMPPAHYTLKIDSYSQFLQTLSNTGRTCYTTQIFGAAGYKWKLSFYPNGDKERNGEGYISMFLTIQGRKSLPVGWEVNVNYKFFVFDQIRNKYLSIQDASGSLSRFDARKTEFGISQLLLYSDFNDSDKGFLIQDNCVLGAEICVVRRTNAGEYISPLKDFEVYKYKWEVSPFSSMTEDKYYSDIFTAGDFKWKLSYYPKGDICAEGESLSFFLECFGLKASDCVYVDYILCIRDQCNSKHEENQLTCWFTSPSCTGWGSENFLSLTELYNPSNGFLVKDKVVFEVQITKIISVQSLF